MKKPYHIVNREEKGASAAIEQIRKIHMVNYCCR